MRSPFGDMAKGALLAGFLLLGLQGSALAETDPVVAFLRDYLKKEGSDGPFSISRVPLNNAHNTIIAYLPGPGWCGTGGCAAVILTQEGRTFRIVEELTLVRLPIVAVPSKSHGWNDIAFPVFGGGIMRRRYAWLKFDGHKYRPENPSDAPQMKSAMFSKGKIVLDASSPVIR